MTNLARYTLEQIVLGVIGTLILLMVVCIPMFYLLGMLFEGHRESIYRIYYMYKIAIWILMGGIMIWISLS